jgi:hypothetical protein
MENKSNKPTAQSDNHSAVTNEIINVKPSQSGGRDDLQHPTTRRRFKVYVHMEVPVGAEVTLEADTPEEAHELAQDLLVQAPVCDHLWRLLHCQKISLKAPQSNQLADVELESVLLDLPPVVLAWDSVDLDSGKHCGSKFQIPVMIRPVEARAPSWEAGQKNRKPNED